MVESSERGGKREYRTEQVREKKQERRLKQEMDKGSKVKRYKTKG